MIFFLTTIQPSSNVESDLRKYRDRLFQNNMLIPHPLLVIPVRLSQEPPVRQSRKSIASDYPEIITPEPLSVDGLDLLVPLNPSIPFSCDPELEVLDSVYPGKIHLGKRYSNGNNVHDFPPLILPSFKNYSLLTYRIETPSVSLWWSKMSWEKILEIRKGK